jgi:hypothetical protein
VPEEDGINWLWESRAQLAAEALFSGTPQVPPRGGTFSTTIDTPGLASVLLQVPLETAGRIMATTDLLHLDTAGAFERSVATQWYLDKALAQGRELVLHGPGRVRLPLQLPLRPARFLEELR